MTASESSLGIAAGRRLVERPAHTPWGTNALLSLLVVALAAGFVAVPIRITTDSTGQRFRGQADLTAALNRAFVEYWASGEPGFTPSLALLVDYWSRYHLVKAVFAGALVAALGLLWMRLWRSVTGAVDRRISRTVASSASWGFVALLAFGAVLLLMANVQGAISPFASLLSMLPVGQRTGQLGLTLGQLRRRVADASADRTDPVVAGILSDFARYHVVLVVVAAIIALASIWLTAVWWRRSTRTALGPSDRPVSPHQPMPDDRRARRSARAAAGGFALTALVMLVLMAANLSTAVHPAPALLAFLGGAT